MSRDNLFTWEDFVPGGFCTGKILGVYLIGKILYPEDFVPGRFCAGKILGVFFT